MVKIIVVGHDVFASSLKSVLEFIAGSQNGISYIDFSKTTTPEALNLLLKKEIHNVEKAIFFCDIPGGTPYKEAVAVADENPNCRVVAGCNLSALLNFIYSDKEASQEVIAESLVQTSIDTTIKYDHEKDTMDFM